MTNKIIGGFIILVGLLNMKYSSWVIYLGIFFIGIGILFIYISKKSEDYNEKEKINEANRIEKKRLLESIYKSSLNGTDKSEALRSGHAYYSSLRKDGNLTIYDEQAIPNDLNSMK